jgi:hypothetical protein
MKSVCGKYVSAVFIVVLFLLNLPSSSVAQSGKVKGNFLYNIASFRGDVPFGWVRITVDRGQNEIYATGREDTSIFRMDRGTPEQNNEFILDQKGGDRENGKNDLNSKEATIVSFSNYTKTSSDKGKPAARWGHKADGSTGGDGRATGERIQEGGLQ